MAKFSRLKTKKSPSQWKWKRNVKGLRETGNSFLWGINLSCTRLIRFLVQENKSVIWTIVLDFAQSCTRKFLSLVQEIT